MYLGLIGLNTIRAKILMHVSTRLTANMTAEYVQNLFSLPLSFFHGARSGEVIERIRDLERVQRFGSIEAIEALTASISILSLSLLLLFVEPLIATIFIASAISYLGWVQIVGRRRRAADAERFRENSRSRAIEIGIVQAIQDIKIAGFESASLAKWAGVQLESVSTRLRAAAIEQMQTWGGHLVTRIGMIIVALVAAQQAISGEITLGEFMITTVVVVQLYFHLNQLLDFVNKLDDVRAAMRRALDVRNLPSEASYCRRRLSAPPEYGPIILEDVSFRYLGANRESLAKVDLQLDAGTMTALVGPSGSGKSTLLKLLLRLHEPTEGLIRIAGIDLADIDHASWREEIGAVLQDGALFTASIRDNIVAGRAQEDSWLARVIDAACLTDVIAQTEKGLDTEVGASGHKLSAGQVQRILIARAIYKRPKLLVLDEATSALDGQNEMFIVRNIQSLLPGVTSVVAAHRLNTVRHAELVVEIDAGKVVAVGTADKILGPGSVPLGLAR